MDKIIEDMTSVRRRYGNQTTETGMSLKRLIIMLGASVLCVESIASTVYRWDQLTRRCLAIEDVNIWTVMLAGMYHFFFLHTENRTVLNILAEKSSDYAHDDETSRILNEFRSKTEKELKYIKLVLSVIFLNYVGTPLVFTAYKTVILKETNVMNLDLPFEFYNLSIFKLKNSMILFVIVNIYQIIFVKIIVDISKYMFISFTGPINKIVLDMKLLCLAIKHIDVRLNATERKQFGNCYQTILKNYMRNIITQHEHLCRNVAQVNKSIRIIAFFTLQCICSQVCLLFYWILQVDITVLKQVIDASQVLAVCGYGYLYSAVGQDIINEDEALRRTLYECSWINKPEWFKQSLLIMMIRASRKLEIQPFGLFVIDYKNFASIMNAAYSYYNILRTAKTY